MGGELVIRVRGSFGQRKINVHANSTFEHLIEQIAIATPYEIEDIELFQDDGRGRPTQKPVLASSHQFLSSLGVSNGTLFHVADRSQPKGSAEEESRKACTLDLAKIAREREEREKEAEKIRNARFEQRSGWSSNTVSFANIHKQRLIKAQKERVCAQAQVTSAAVKILVKDFVDSGYTRHCCALLYGTYKRRKERINLFKWRDGVVVDQTLPSTKMRMETMWRPPQRGDMEGVTILTEEGEREIERADAIAKLLGLQCVGAILTVPLQNARSGEIRLRSRDLKEAAKLQAKYGEGFTTLIVPVGQEEDGRVWSSCEAWQCTEPCVQLWSQGDIEEEQPNPDMLKLKDLVVVYRETNGVAKETEAVSVEVEMFQKKIPVQVHRTRFMGPSVFSGGQSDLRDYITQFKAKPWNKILADFNVLMFLSEDMDMTIDMPKLCSEISGGEQISEGYVLMIEQRAGML